MTLIDAGVRPETDDLSACQMQVRKRDGSFEPVDVNKIVRAVSRSCKGLDGVDALRVAQRTISGLCDGATTEELDSHSIRTAAALMSEEPNYSLLAARLLATVIDKEVANQDIHSFSQSIALGRTVWVWSASTPPSSCSGTPANLTTPWSSSATACSSCSASAPFTTGTCCATPRAVRWSRRLSTSSYGWPCGLSTSPEEAIGLYTLMSSLEYLPSSPTLFNSGTTHEQMSSCYLLDSPRDELDSIYDTYGDIARLSKHAGGIGVGFHRVRSRGSLIKGTNGLSNGIVPWLKTLDASVAAVNQGGRRKGAACVYLESWHADIEEFLELRDNTGEDARRVRHINLANWVPDLFMERVEHDWMWSLFDPKVVPELCDLHGEAFEQAYLEAEEQGLLRAPGTGPPAVRPDDADPG